MPFMLVSVTKISTLGMWCIVKFRS